MTEYILTQGPNSPTPLWHVVSADFDGNGFVTAYDQVLMRRCLLGLPLGLPSDWHAWRFVPYPNAGNPLLYPGYNPQGPVPQGVSNLHQIHASITVTPDQNNAIFLGGMSFWGVKRGDIYQQCADCSFSLPLTGERSASAVRQLLVEGQSLKRGETMLIPVKLGEDISEVRMLNFALLLDAKRVEEVAVYTDHLSNDDVLSNIVERDGYFEVRFSVADMGATGSAFFEGEPLCYLRIKTYEDVALSDIFAFDPSNQLNTAITGVFGNIRDKVEVAVRPYAKSEPTFEVCVIQEYPGAPPRGLEIESPAASTLNIQVVSSIAFAQRIVGLEGETYLTFDRSAFGTGLYRVVIHTDSGNSSIPFVVLS